MSIIGIGCDILNIERINKIINKFGNRFAKRILSKKEYYELFITKNKKSFIAKRFAVKEALFKSLGIGIRNKIKFKNFELSHDNLGKPILIFLKNVEKIKKEKNIRSIHVSISDEKKYIFAIVILENKN